MKTFARTLCVLGLLAVVPAQAATFCVKPTMSTTCYTSIQTAVNDAANTALAMDEVHTIAISSGTYFEEVVVTNDTELAGLIIKGSASAIIDPAQFDNPAFTISAPNVTISGLSINNVNDDGIFVNDTGDGFVLTKVRFNNVTLDCVDLETDVDNAVITGNTFLKCGESAVELTGDSANISKNKITNTGTAISIVGDGTLIESNSCTNVGSCVLAGAGSDNVSIKKNKAAVLQSVAAYVVTGNDVLIESNSAVGSGFSFITVIGEDPRVLANKSKEIWGGISVTCAADCDAALVERNSQTNSSNGTCVATDFDAAGGNVLNNMCRQVVAGFSLTGDSSSTATGNKLLYSKNDGFSVLTPMAASVRTLTNNSASYAGGDGFDVNGEAAATLVAHQIIGNKALKNGQDGFNFDDKTNGMTVNNNTATGNIMEGFDHRGAATSFDGNKASGNRQGSDFCDEGDNGAVYGTNSFASETATCEF